MSGRKDNPEISKRHKDRIAELEGKDQEMLTLAQRLTARALKRTITVDLGFDGEPFPVKFYVPMGDEHEEMFSVMGQFMVAKGKAKKALADKMYQLLADLAVDPSLDFAYWSDVSNYSNVDLAKVYESLTVRLTEMVNQAAKFRTERPGPGAD